MFLVKSEGRGIEKQLQLNMPYVTFLLDEFKNML